MVVLALAALLAAAAPAPAKDGLEAAFEYGNGKASETYLIWKDGKTKRYKADPKDLKLRAILHRLGVNDYTPEH